MKFRFLVADRNAIVVLSILGIISTCIGFTLDHNVGFEMVKYGALVIFYASFSGIAYLIWDKHIPAWTQYAACFSLFVAASIIYFLAHRS